MSAAVKCPQELCGNWSGDGRVCPCAVFDLEPDVSPTTPTDCPDCDHPFHGTDRCELYVNYGCSRDADCPGDSCCDRPCPCDGVLS